MFCSFLFRKGLIQTILGARREHARHLLHLWCCGLRRVVLVVVLLLVVRLFGRRLGFGVESWLGVRFEVEEDLDLEVCGRLCFPVCCQGAWVACVGSGGPR